LAVQGGPSCTRRFLATPIYEIIQSGQSVPQVETSDLQDRRIGQRNEFAMGGRDENASRLFRRPLAASLRAPETSVTTSWSTVIDQAVFKKTRYVADSQRMRRVLAKDLSEDPNKQDFTQSFSEPDMTAPFADANVTGAMSHRNPTRLLFRATEQASGVLSRLSRRIGISAGCPAKLGRGPAGTSVMRMFERTIMVALLIGAGLTASATAFEGTPVNPENKAIPIASTQPATAAALGKQLPANASPGALTNPLPYATEGDPITQFRLGKMYADGSGVVQDDLRAFEYFSRIANAHAEDSPSAPQAAVVARAFVALGRYYLDGIPNSKIKRDPERAREMFSYAASYFGNADAQYDLARLYIDGVGIPSDLRYGARWLGLAAQKGQHRAQALLGQMLFTGEKLPRQAARGLMWLTLARDSAAADETWIRDSYNKAFAKASDDDRAMALQMLEHWVQGRRDY
jgi:uncharacterized protein